MPKRGTPTEIPGLSRDGTKWHLRVLVKGPDGRRYERQKVIDGATGKPTRRELVALEDELERMRAELKRDAEGQVSGAPTHEETVGDFAPRWIEHTAATGKARRHVVEKREQHLRTYILPFIGDVELRALRRSHVVNWMTSVATMRQPGRKLYSRHTLISVWATLRAMLRRAVIMRDLERDPTLGVKFDIGDHVGGEPRPDRRPKETLTREELARILEAAKTESPDVRAMIVVQVSTGMRFCELSALEWRDVNLDAARLRIERSQVEGQVGAPKTEVTRRDVYLSPAVVEALKEHRRWQVEQQVAGLSKGLVFPSAVGGYRNPALFRKPLARCCKLAGVDKHISSHCLRKTANNLLRQHNSSDVVVRAMIGHATSEMTRLYSNVGEDEKARAHAAAFGDVFDIAVGLKGGAAGESHETPGVERPSDDVGSRGSTGLREGTGRDRNGESPSRSCVLAVR